MACHVRPGLLRDGTDIDRCSPPRPAQVRHGAGVEHAAPGRPDDRGRAGKPEDGTRAAPDLRPDGRPEVGHLHGGLRVQRRHVQQLRHRAGRGPHRPGGHLPPRLPATPGDAAGCDRQAARQDPEHEAGRQPGGGGRGTGAGQAPAAAAHPGGRWPAGYRRWPASARGALVTSENAPDNSDKPDPAAAAGELRLGEQVERTGMFGTETTGDTSGYGGLQVRRPGPAATGRPYGSYFDEIADRLAEGLERDGPAVARLLRDEPSLGFEMCLGVSGVHYPWDAGNELHAVYPLLSITHNRRVRLEVSAPDSDPRIPSLVSVYPTCDWHERETWDFFGVVFEGHPALTRIEMPDDWKGHPQRKDYPLGGIPVEYRGATVPPPEDRRAYS